MKQNLVKSEIKIKKFENINKELPYSSDEIITINTILLECIDSFFSDIVLTEETSFQFIDLLYNKFIEHPKFYDSTNNSIKIQFYFPFITSLTFNIVISKLFSIFKESTLSEGINVAFCYVIKKFSTSKEWEKPTLLVREGPLIRVEQSGQSPLLGRTCHDSPDSLVYPGQGVISKPLDCTENKKNKDIIQICIIGNIICEIINKIFDDIPVDNNTILNELHTKIIEDLYKQYDKKEIRSLLFYNIYKSYNEAFKYVEHCNELTNLSKDVQKKIFDKIKFLNKSI